MYDQTAKVQDRAYHEMNAQRYAGGAIGSATYPGDVGVNLASSPRQLISTAMLMELNAILEKAQIINNRQSNLKDRIFGSSPVLGTDAKSSQPMLDGFLHEANAKIQMINAVMDLIMQNCTELERLA